MAWVMFGGSATDEEPLSMMTPVPPVARVCGRGYLVPKEKGGMYNWRESRRTQLLVRC